jgi:signal transduction histidine kinase
LVGGQFPSAQTEAMKQPYSLRVALIYFFLGCLWIIFSDQLLLKLFTDTKSLTQLQMYKGWLFVTVSAIVIFLLVKRFEQTLSKTIQRLRQSNDDLRLFLYKTSHNLRGPVASSIGLVRLARNSSDKEELAAYLEKMEMLGEKTDQILKDLINLAKIIEGDLHYEEIGVAKEVQACWEEISRLHKVTDIEFTLEVADELKFSCDRSLFQMIVQNLVENAVKYRRHEDAPSYLRITAERSKENVTLRFIDNGRGIEQEVQNKIFSMFFRASHHQTGVGMGLYIVNTATKRLRGLVGVHTELGKGSTFTVVLPTKPF